MKDGRALLAVEAEGLRQLKAHIRCSGIIFRADGESFEHFCARIALDYEIPVEEAQVELEHFE